MADQERTEVQPQQASQAYPVKIYEYIVPGSAVVPPRIVYPGAARRSGSLAEWLLRRWMFRRYGRP